MRRRLHDDPFGFAPPFASRAFLGSLIGGGLGLIGGILGGNEANRATAGANRANKARYREARSLHTKQQRMGKELFDRAEGFTSESLAAGREAASLVRGETEKVGRAAYRNLVDREQQQLTQGRASLERRGLSNSTALDASVRGIQTQTSRAMAELSERVALLRTGAIQSSADILQRSLGNMASFLTGRAGFETGLIGQEIGTITGRQDVPNPNAGSFWNSLGQLGGQIGAGYDQWQQNQQYLGILSRLGSG